MGFDNRTLRLHAVKPGNIYDDYWCSLWDRVNSSIELEQKHTRCITNIACRESFYENQIKNNNNNNTIFRIFI